MYVGGWGKGTEGWLAASFPDLGSTSLIMRLTGWSNGGGFFFRDQRYRHLILATGEKPRQIDFVLLCIAFSLCPIGFEHFGCLSTETPSPTFSSFFSCNAFSSLVISVPVERLALGAVAGSLPLEEAALEGETRSCQEVAKEEAKYRIHTLYRQNIMRRRSRSAMMAASSLTHHGTSPSPISLGNTSVVTWWLCIQ